MFAEPLREFVGAVAVYGDVNKILEASLTKMKVCKTAQACLHDFHLEAASLDGSKQLLIDLHGGGDCICMHLAASFQSLPGRF